MVGGQWFPAWLIRRGGKEGGRGKKMRKPSLEELESGSELFVVHNYTSGGGCLLVLSGHSPSLFLLCSHSIWSNPKEECLLPNPTQGC